jgi:hypothetical protein
MAQIAEAKAKKSGTDEMTGLDLEITENKFL